MNIDFKRNKKIAKRILGMGLVTMFTILIVGCSNSSSSHSTSDTNTAKLALLTGASGAGAAYGQSIKEGAELAVEQINKKEGSIKINLIIEDTKGDKNEAITATNKVIHKDNVVAIVGPMLSGEMFAIGPIAQSAKTVIFSTATTAEGITDIGSYVFRNAVPESKAVGAAIRESHKKLGYKTVGIIYSVNNDQLVSVYKTALKEFKELGVTVVSTDSFADKDTDFSAQVANIQKANPDIILVAAHLQEGSIIMKKLRQVGMNQQVIGSNGFNSPVYIQTAGDAANGSIVGTPWFPDRDSQITRDFRTAYKAKYNKEPDQFAAQAYDGIYLMEAALQKAGSTTDREKLREALQSIKDIVGVTGNFKFDANRNPDMDVQVLNVVNGAYKAF